MTTYSCTLCKIIIKCSEERILVHKKICKMILQSEFEEDNLGCALTDKNTDTEGFKEIHD